MLALSQYNLEELADVVEKAFKKLFEECGSKWAQPRSENLAKECVKNIGVVGVLSVFEVEFRGKAQKYFKEQKELSRFYTDCKKAKPGSITVIPGPSNIQYAAQILKSYLIDFGYPMDS